MDTSQFEAMVHDPQLAIQNLTLVLSHANSEDEEIANSCVAALENCGAPPLKSLSELSTSLEAPDATQVYWTATLIGRLVSNCLNDPDEPPLDHVDLQRRLINRLQDSELEAFASERLIWALGQFSKLDAGTVDALEGLRPRSNQRMSRLIDEAIAKRVA